ncbi:unnamed protein product [Fraxinus pennsylvanica]|uniref:Heparan-alpha-glucosaminide N-acetyltransferase catalytic domain-containing protein n=1 Tax=Fraxinus pennsylvanica TaxID=56036 RepID=A0AAD2E9C7_9LAMI|nr:unnamed protein product [Fraxinus pennsylvanica]
MMASIVVVTDTDGGDRAPLLQNSQPEESPGDVIVSSTTSVDELPDKSQSNISTDPKQRLVSLDVFRGVTIALMISVDDAGKAFPSINHAPWFGVTIADFVMPFFLFGVGVSVSLVFMKVPNKSAATKKVILRTIKLFLLGVILQGGYFHGRGHLTYGVDVEKIRLMGVLQRIAIGYVLASVLEIWLINNTVVDSAVAFMKRYSFQSVAAILLGLLYMILLYGLYVPNWTFEVSTLSINSSTSLFGVGIQTVQCGVRSSLEPPCNAVGFLDRFLLGEQHLYQRPVYRRTKECSVNSPDYGPLPPNSPAWCLAPFDPEGILSSLMAAITCLIGLHYGHILVHCKDQMQRVILWSISSLPLLISGFLLSVVGVPFSKPLYTLSYMFITAGASGTFLTIIFYIVDVKCIRKPMVIFQWMGMNALIIYALAACDVFPEAMQGFYWRSPENNLVDFSERLLQTVLHSEKWGTLAFVMVEILFWGLVADQENTRGTLKGMITSVFFLDSVCELIVNIFYFLNSNEELENDNRDVHSISLWHSLHFKYFPSSVLNRQVKCPLDNAQWERLGKSELGLRITIPKAISMATSEQEINELSGTSDSCHCHQNEAQKSREKAESHMGKAIAHRAVYGSSHRRGRSARLRNNIVKTLPSRLSKVSIADEPEN